MSDVKDLVIPKATGMQLHGQIFSDAEYVDELDNRPWWASMTVILFVGRILFIAWAAYFQIDQSVRATGQIIATARNQIVQVADGGVLAEMLVTEGQQVKVGERLAVLEKVRAEAKFEETRSRAAALEIALIRAQAESRRQTPVFPARLQEYADFIRAQKRLYKQKSDALAEALIIRRQNLRIAEQQLSINESLYTSADVSLIEVMGAEARVADENGKLQDVLNEYLTQALEESASLETDLALVQQEFAQRENVLSHTNILAPVAGIVKYLRINTQGGVMRPGDELVQISPTESELIVEVQVSPVDIGQLSLGLPVTVKLDAFDSSIYGSVEGELIYLSSDTLNEQGPSGQTLTYYRGHVRLLPDFAETNPKFAGIALRSGMTAGVDIRTGKRTILQFLGKPILRAFSGALTQR
ncbi:HlyD family efflux transporter periplasmic adaptor subunit [Pseudomonadales bacterium]|nr:HlyD family efflux transporter periplasmic adaptor subunit [Pseudomonadales bacterium]